MLTLNKHLFLTLLSIWSCLLKPFWIFYNCNVSMTSTQLLYDKLNKDTKVS